MFKKMCLILLAITVFVVILIPDRNTIPRDAQFIGGGYYKNGNDVYFETGGGFFLQLHDPYEAYRIDEADGKTFSYLGNSFAKDKNHVYFTGRIIKGANPDKFKFASGSFSQYVIDDKNVWYGDEAIPLVDIETFSYLGNSFAKDKNHVYFTGRIIKGANPDKFKFASGSFSQYVIDDKNVWYGDELLQDRDPGTFGLIYDIFPHEYTKDKENVWYNREIIVGADPKTFELLRPTDGLTTYSKDKNYVYLNGKKIDIDTKTVKVVEGQTGTIRFLRDQYGVYCFESKREGHDKLQLNGINLNTFELLNSEYLRDDKHVYFANCTYQGFYFKIVKGADPKTFKIK
ncbi:MAG: DKNYY domain-containing protein [Candidatus Gracilibacteria bacterium]